MSVCIAGMHRSGTSMVTKLLHDAGLYLGPESDLHPPGPANPEGFWENRRFVRLNGRVLQQLGGDWDYPPAMPASWTTDMLVPFRAEAETLLEHFRDREPWGWKDPRNCLTLPFWQSLLDRLRVVIVVRNPLEVAESLRKRNGFSRALGFALWHEYNRRLLDAVAPADRVVTHYDAYFRDPGPELRRLLAFLGMPVDEDQIKTASNASLADLRHHQLTTRNLIAADVAPAVLDLYHGLCTEANWLDVRLGDTESGGADRSGSRDVTPGPSDEPTASEFAGRPNRRSAQRGGGRVRHRLEEAEARIAELERTVQTQRLALAEQEALERDLNALRGLIRDRAEDLGLAQDQLETMVGRDVR